MAKTLIGRPAAGLQVRDPAHDMRHVPDEFREYPATDYWRRRFSQGDMVAPTADELAAYERAQAAAATTRDAAAPAAEAADTAEPAAPESPAGTTAKRRSSSAG